MRISALLPALLASVAAFDSPALAQTAGGSTSLPALHVTRAAERVVPQAPRRAARTARRTAPAAAQRRAAPGPRLLAPAIRPPVAPVVVAAPVAPDAPQQISQEALRAQGASSLGDALGDRPGVSATGYAPGSASRPILRGLGGDRIRIQTGGIGSGDVSTLGDDHAVTVNPLMAQSIDILRGPEALRYGMQSVGGVISANDGRIPEVAIPGARFQQWGALSSVDKGREAASVFDAAGKNVAIRADWFGRNSEDYRTPAGVQRNSASRWRGFGLGGSYVFDNGFIGGSVENISGIYRVPGVNGVEAGTRIDLEQTRFRSRGRYNPDGGLIESFEYWAGYSVYGHHESGVGDDGIDGVQATFHNREWEGRFEARHRPILTGLGPLSGLAGFQFSGAFLGAGGEAQSLIASTYSRSLAVYALEKLELRPDTRIEAALRFEQWRISGTPAAFPSNYLPPPDDLVGYPTQRNFSPLSTSVTLAHDLQPGLTASIGYNHSERAPRPMELFARGAHDASGTFEIGDARLNKETANGGELALRKTDGRLRFDLRAFFTKFNGFIYDQQTGVYCGEDFASCGASDEFKQVVFRQQGATFFGGEAFGQYDLAEIGGGVFAVDGRYDFVRARLSDGSNVPRMPPQRLGGGLSWRDANWMARANIIHAFAQNATSWAETRTPGYNLVNAELRYTQKLDPTKYGAQEISFALVGSNLLNAWIRNSTSYLKDEVLAPGRNFKLSAQVKF